jgi:predicted dehydrogenase
MKASLTPPGSKTTQRIAVLGAGDHSQRSHLPALVEFAWQHPGTVALAALCDLRRDHAAMLAERYGFQRVYDDLDEMLALEHLNGCIAVTPVAETARLATRIFQAGIPLLMEKPPGATLEEASQVVALAERSSVPVMVSMNRRFDPALRAGLNWLGERSISYVRVTMARHNRREANFFTETAIHLIDTVRFIGGEVLSWQPQVSRVDGVKWARLALKFASGAAGWVEIMPTAGCMMERYEIFGADYHLDVRVGGVDAGEACGWDSGRLDFHVQADSSLPEHIVNGTLAETTAFLTGLLEGKPFAPTPAQVLQSVELCHAIQNWPED